MGFQLVSYPGQLLWPQTFDYTKPASILDPPLEDTNRNTWLRCLECGHYHMLGQSCPGIVNIPSPFTMDPMPPSVPWTITVAGTNAEIPSNSDVSGAHITMNGDDSSEGSITFERMWDEA